MSAASNLLNTRGFSQSLKEATATSTSDGDTTASGMSTTNRHGTPNRHNGSNSSTSLSTDEKISIGAGIGGGFGVVAVAVLMFACWQRGAKKKHAVFPSSTSRQTPAMSRSGSASLQQACLGPYWELEHDRTFPELSNGHMVT